MSIWFHLGREQTLCRLEVISLANYLGLTGVISPGDESGMACSELSLEEAVSIARQAGGVVRLVAELGQLAHPDARGVVELLEREGVIDAWASQGERVEYGASRLPATQPRARQLQWQDRIGLQLKQALKTRSARSRYIPWPRDGETQLSTVQVEQNGLLTPPGREVVVWNSGDRYRVGLTQWVQPFEEFAARDMDRPRRLRRRGMLPPKLARILINLGRRPDTGMVLDPFCGSGGLLAEALEMGLRAVGADISEQAVQASRENLTWSAARLAEAPPWEVRTGDVCQLLSWCAPLSVDLIATETLLGPALEQRPDAKQAAEYAAELRKLYLPAIGQLRTVLKPGGRAVIAFPCWNTPTGVVHLRIRSELAMAGFSEVYYPSASALWVEQPYVYLRPDQFVGRAIMVLE